MPPVNFVSVVLSVAIRHSLTYRLPPEMGTPESLLGYRVCVPLGTKKVVGCIIGRAISEENPRFKIRDVEQVLDQEPLLSLAQLELLRWASQYYLTPLGEVLRHFAPPEIFSLKEKKTTRKKSGVKKNLDSFQVFQESTPETLTKMQAQGLQMIESLLDSSEKKPILLYGVTGSGKTEVYRQAAQKVLAEKGQVLVLVPEIGMTPQVLGRFQSLGAGVGLYHSGLAPARRLETWEKVRRGELGLIVATRSGVFLPFAKLKLVILDEEHDSSFKQEERFCYHARQVILWRAQRENLTVVLGSATPSVETYHRMKQEKIIGIRLDERPGKSELPIFTVVDRRRQKEKGLISQILLDALRRHGLKKHQSLIFLNRRGYSPFVLCPDCGFVPRCTVCEISLTLHQDKDRNKRPSLVCHYCDHAEDFPFRCPSCHQGGLQPEGFGTQRLVSELSRSFPGARLARLDRDTMGRKGWLTVLEKMKKKEIDILVGTQVITKGHDYPDLTLVGILDADQSLLFPDFRAAERTYQMITQVAGRAGRGSERGQVILQSYRPEDPNLQAAMGGDEAGFYERELQHRREQVFPPFCRLIEVRFVGATKSLVEKISALFCSQLKKSVNQASPNALNILGPAPCLVEKVRNHFRWHALIKTTQYSRLQPTLRRFLDDFMENNLPSPVRMLVNVDPLEMS